MALVEVIDKEPSEVGYTFRIWTVERLSAHLEKITGIVLNKSCLRTLIKRKGYRCMIWVTCKTRKQNRKLLRYLMG